MGLIHIIIRCIHSSDIEVHISIYQGNALLCYLPMNRNFCISARDTQIAVQSIVTFHITLVLSTFLFVLERKL